MRHTRPMFLALAALTLPLTAACGSDDEGSVEEEQCDLWFDLAEAENPSDDEARAALDQIRALDETTEVGGTAGALSARLRDGVDISTSFKRMNDLCADV